MARWTKPPANSYGEPWERWAYEMMRRGFSAWQVASKAGVPETRVTQAYHREEARRDVQSEADAVRAAESCLLADAERHMAELEPRGGRCWECDYFHEVQSSDELPAGLRRQLDFCGACVVGGSVTIVDRSEWHSWDECWEVH